MMKINSTTLVGLAAMVARSFSTRLAPLMIVLMAAMPILAQTAAFTFQGKLSDVGNPANGNYDFQFKLYAAITGGTEIGVRTRTGVPVTGGVFTVQLDFAVGAYTGLDRFLEIGVRPAGSPDPFITLSPRQPITSSPYAFHSLSSDVADAATTATNANQLGGVNASQYVLTTDARMTDARPPTPGSPNYIQNSTSQQATSNFNISGNGAVGGTLSSLGAINTSAQYNIGNNRVLSIAGTNNTFAGLNAGANNTGSDNSFFGRNAGFNNSNNSNSFFGVDAGKDNTSGDGNSFFGWRAGMVTTDGGVNCFFGFSAGSSNTTGGDNVFVGRSAGHENVSGGSNTFIGDGAGFSNTTGENNTTLGVGADVGANNLSFATAIGALAIVNSSNTIVLGRNDGSDFVRIPGLLTIPNLAAAGMTNLCRNSFDRVGDCSSSLRYKTNLAPYTSGLSIINRLRPISFTWKEGGTRDLGFGAEDVEKVDSLLVTYNKQGQVEGVKYDRVTVVLVNAIREQQVQIDSLQAELKRQLRLNEQFKHQQDQIEGLTKLVCAANASAELCKK